MQTWSLAGVDQGRYWHSKMFSPFLRNHNFLDKSMHWFSQPHPALALQIKCPCLPIWGWQRCWTQKLSQIDRKITCLLCIEAVGALYNSDFNCTIVGSIDNKVSNASDSLSTLNSPDWCHLCLVIRAWRIRKGHDLQIQSGSEHGCLHHCFQKSVSACPH